MDLTTLKSLQAVYPKYISKYKELLNDPNVDIDTKINCIIQGLNQTNLTFNQLVTNWNQVMQWAMNDGLDQAVITQMNAIVADGQFQTTLNNIVSKEGDLTKLTNPAPDLVTAINGNTSQLADIAYDVKSYGAKGDGVTDDITAINNAVTACSNNGGGIVYFPKGTYMVSSSVKILSNVIYQGSGWGSIIKAHPTSADNVMGDYGASPAYQYNVVIRDLCIDGNSANVNYNQATNNQTDDAYQNGIRFFKTQNWLIERVLIQNTVMNALSVYFLSSYGTIDKSYIKNVGKSTNAPNGFVSYNGVFVEYACQNVTVRNTNIDTTRHMGIICQIAGDGSINNITLDDVRIFNTYDKGIAIKDQDGGATTGTLSNINIKGGLLSNCCTGTSEAALRIQRTTSGKTVDDVDVNGLQVVNSNYIGVLLDTGSNRTKLRGITVTGSKNKGIIDAGTDNLLDNCTSLNSTVTDLDYTGATRTRFTGGFTGNVAQPYDGRTGTFTPTVLLGGANTGLTYGAQQGSYTVKGNKVEFSIHVSLTAKGTSTGNLTIGGLPFISNASAPFSAVDVFTNNVTWTTVPTGLILNSASQINLYAMQSGAGSNALTDGNVSNTSEFYISGSYQI